MTRTASLPCLLVAVAACGGTTPAPDPGTTSSSGGRACTTMGCVEGVLLDFSYRDKGSYFFDVKVDDVVVTCKATLPLAKDPPLACDRPEAQLGVVGSMLPETGQSIGGLTFPSTTATKITVRVMRDGVELANQTFSPSYTTSAGPNGPGCEPSSCTLAKETLR